MFDDKKLIIFDWDGTLFDTRPICKAAALLTVEKIWGKVDLSVETLKSIETDPVRSVFRELNISDEILKKRFIYEYFSLYRAIENGYPLIDDTYEFLLYLLSKKYKLAIATGRSKARLFPLLEEKKLGSFFYTVRCIEDGPKKPDPYILLSIIDELSLVVDDAIFIGDSWADHLASINANIDFIYAKYAINREIVTNGSEIIHKIDNIQALYNLF